MLAAEISNQNLARTIGMTLAGGRKGAGATYLLKAYYLLARRRADHRYQAGAVRGGGWRRARRWLIGSGDESSDMALIERAHRAALACRRLYTLAQHACWHQNAMRRSCQPPRAIKRSSPLNARWRENGAAASRANGRDEGIEKRGRRQILAAKSAGEGKAGEE